MHRTKITVLIALSAVFAFLPISSFTSLAGDARKPGAFENGKTYPDSHPASLQLMRAVSQKKHGTGGAGPIFEIETPLTATLTSGTSGVEARQGGDSDGGGAGDYKIVLTFNGHDPITGGTAGVTAHNPAGAGGVVDTGGIVHGFNEMIIPLTGVTNGQVLTVTASNVTDGSSVISSAEVNIGFLLGDTTSDRVVNVGDTNHTKSRSGETTGEDSKRNDVNVDGRINVGDTNLVKSHSGSAIP